MSVKRQRPSLHANLESQVYYFLRQLAKAPTCAHKCLLHAQPLTQVTSLECRTADITYANHSSLMTSTTLRRLVLVWAADEGATISHVPDTPFSLHATRPTLLLVMSWIDGDPDQVHACTQTKGNNSGQLRPLR